MILRRVIALASVNVSIQMDFELKAQVGQVLSQLGMNMISTINMFLGNGRNRGLGEMNI